MDLPEIGSRWERNDEVYRVEDVYVAKQSTLDGTWQDVILVKFILVEPMPWHYDLSAFLKTYAPEETCERGPSGQGACERGTIGCNRH